jgi:hypothetical protein
MCIAIVIVDLIKVLGIYLPVNLHLSPKIKGHILGICVLCDMFVIVLHFPSLLQCFGLDLYSVDILQDFGDHFFH